jgi:hypothetical protein
MLVDCCLFCLQCPLPLHPPGELIIASPQATSKLPPYLSLVSRSDPFILKPAKYSIVVQRIPLWVLFISERPYITKLGLPVSIHFIFPEPRT